MKDSSVVGGRYIEPFSDNPGVLHVVFILELTSPLPTFLSRLLVPDEWCAFKKPAVVDQRVGFFLDGGSSVWTRDSPPPLNGPLMVSRAGSLLRRTWRGISEKQETQQGC